MEKPVTGGAEHPFPLPPTCHPAVLFRDLMDSFLASVIAEGYGTHFLLLW